MKKNYILLLFSLLMSTMLLAQKDKEKKGKKKEQEKIEKSGLDSAQYVILEKIQNMKFQTEGEVSIANGKAKINIPAGFKYLDKAQSNYILHDFWGNPNGASDGMLFLTDAGLLDDKTWAFVVRSEDEGHIDDSDAKEMKYDELLTQMKDETKEGSIERVKLGYETIELIGWASPPYYDESQKTLHWAKELAFGTADEHTLNYDVRILGREGLVSMNAVGGMETLEEVKTNIPSILKAVSFVEGNKYSDFNPSMDKLAAVGIGGLIAGKVLAKAGFFVILLKYFKILTIPLVAVGAWIKKKFMGGGEE
jgi:uncharacterized membrane-anchored protein